MEWNFGSKFWKVTFCVLNTWIFDDLRGKLTYSGYYILEYRGAVFLTWRFILSYFFFLLLLTACWVKGKLNLRERCWGKLFLCQFLSSLSLCFLSYLCVFIGRVWTECMGENAVKKEISRNISLFHS